MKKRIAHSICMMLLLSFIIHAQQYQLKNSIGSFKDANSFYITPGGIIYVTDAGNNELLSLDTLGNILQFTGGYGWSETTFDEPSDVFATTLSIYIADKNNHRIQRFDRNLNFVSTLSTRERDNQNAKFGYPLSCAVSNQGDLYILDDENQRVVKFDLFGKFIQNFGGFDAGNFQLSKPVSLGISHNNFLFVADESGIVIFDAFGNGIERIPISEPVVSIRIIFGNLIISSEESVYHINLNSGILNPEKLSIQTDQLKSIRSSFAFNNDLYILTEHEILIFTLLN